MKIKIKKVPGYKEGGDWIQHAVNPSNVGDCTPMTKSTCTGHKKAFAKTMKKHHGFHKKQEGGNINTTGYLDGADTANNDFNIIPSSNITTQGMKFPILANGQPLYPNTGDYNFNTSHVVETPLKKKQIGGKFKIKGDLSQFQNLFQGFGQPQQFANVWDETKFPTLGNNDGQSMQQDINTGQYFNKKGINVDLLGNQIMKEGGKTGIPMPMTNKSVTDYNPHTNFYKTSTSNINQTTDVPITDSVHPVDKEDANLEAEKDELLMKPGMSGIYKIKGKTHKQGGTPLAAEGGSFIFSNDKKLALNKNEKELFDLDKYKTNAAKENTPAKVLAREVKPKEYNKFISILEDEKAGDIAKNTALLMLQKMQAKIGQVAFIQESKKGEPVPDFAEGSAPAKRPEFDQYEKEQEMYQSGGSVLNYLNQPFDQWAPAQTLPTVDVLGKRKLKPGEHVDRNGIHISDAVPTANPQTGVSSKGWNGMTDFSDIVDYADAVHYPGRIDTNDLRGSFKNIQQHVMQNYPDLVAKYHGAPAQGGYGMPNAGVPDDGEGGVRWNAIGNTLRGNSMVGRQIQGIVPTQAPNVQPIGAPSTNIPGQPSPSVPTLPYDIKGKLTPAQIASLSQLGLQAMSTKKYTPMRSQVDLSTLDFQKTNTQPYLNNINNQGYAAYKLAGLQRAGTASNIGSNILGKTLDQSSQVLGNIENQDNQRRTGVDQINLGQKTNETLQNEQLNSRYYDQTVQANENYDREKRYAGNQFFSTLNQYQSQDDALAAQLASVNRYGRRPVYDNKGNLVAYKPVPLYEYKTNGTIQYNKDVADLSLASGADRTNSLTELSKYSEQLRALGYDPKQSAYILKAILQSKSPIYDTNPTIPQ